MEQIKELYIFVQLHNRTSASSIRTNAMINAFVGFGIKVHLISLGEIDPSYYNCDQIEYQEVCKKHYHVRRGDWYLQLFLNSFSLNRYLRKLPFNSNVLLIGCRDYLHHFVKRKDLHLFQEVTEHPDVIRLWNKRRYLHSCQRLDGLFVISTALKKFYVTMGFPEEKIQIVNMFVDSSRFKNLKKTIEFKKYITYCGNMRNSKDGVNILLKAFLILAKHRKDCTLMMIGPYDGRFDLFLKNNSIIKRVIFTGSVENTKIPQLLINSDILVLARTDSVQAKHGFPTKLGEYLITQNPVVVTDTSDIRKFLVDNESAFIVKPGSADEVANKLDEILNCYDDALCVGKRGAEVAKIHFDSIKETYKIVHAFGLSVN